MTEHAILRLFLLNKTCSYNWLRECPLTDVMYDTWNFNQVPKRVKNKVNNLVLFSGKFHFHLQLHFSNEPLPTAANSWKHWLENTSFFQSKIFEGIDFSNNKPSKLQNFVFTKASSIYKKNGADRTYYLKSALEGLPITQKMCPPLYLQVTQSQGLSKSNQLHLFWFKPGCGADITVRSWCGAHITVRSYLQAQASVTTEFFKLLCLGRLLPTPARPLLHISLSIFSSPHQYPSL